MFNGVTNVRLYYAYGSPVDVLDACYLLGRFNAESVYINSPKKNVNLILWHFDLQWCVLYFLESSSVLFVSCVYDDVRIWPFVFSWFKFSLVLVWFLCPPRVFVCMRTLIRLFKKMNLRGFRSFPSITPLQNFIFVVEWIMACFFSRPLIVIYLLFY